MKNFIVKKLFNAKNCIIFFFNALFTTTTFHAAQTNFGKGAVKASDNLLKELEAIYCGSLFFLLLGVNVVWLAVTKNEKVMGILKKTLIGLLVAYIVLKLLAGNSTVITGTADTVTSWLE